MELDFSDFMVQMAASVFGVSCILWHTENLQKAFFNLSREYFKCSFDDSMERGVSGG